ncbi:MAG: glycosyltransferase family 4 protein [Mariprofundaceae bacterium]|nr:glycosyltransferase family 4 protein [Mariprofundaceae bacterium]
MNLLAFITHLIFALLLASMSGFITWWMLKRVKIMDVPNERSSHERPTPSGGGMAIVITFMVGVIAIFVFADAHIDRRFFWGFLVSTLAIATISYYDDIKNYSAKIKLVTHFFAVLLVLAAGNVLDELALPVFDSVELGWAGYLLTFFWLLGLSNAYNFMDGIDGMAASMAVITCAFFGWITFHQGSHVIYIVCYSILAGAAGFLFWNRPPARIFMGDIGSAFLGFTLACMAIIADRYDMSHTSFLVVPLLLFHFIFDTSFTMCRRALHGENITQAHRTHLYQLLVRMGMSHASVTGSYCLLGIIQGFAAISMMELADEQKLWMFLPFLLLYSLLAREIISRAKRLAII